MGGIARCWCWKNLWVHLCETFIFAFQSWRPSSAQRLWHIPISALGPITGSYSSVFCALIQERSFTIAVDIEGWGLVEGTKAAFTPNQALYRKAAGLCSDWGEGCACVSCSWHHRTDCVASSCLVRCVVLVSETHDFQSQHDTDWGDQKVEPGSPSRVWCESRCWSCRWSRGALWQLLGNAAFSSNVGWTQPNYPFKRQFFRSIV